MARWNLLFIGFISLALFVGCSTAPKGSDGKELRKKLYLDANLEFTLTVPQDWTRSFVPARVGSPAVYSVLWQAQSDKNDPELAPARIQVSLLPSAEGLDEKQLVKQFKLSHPGFNATAVRLLEDVLFTTVEILGHTSSRIYRVLTIQHPEHTYQISFSSLPEKFDENQAMFDLILTSFSPID